MKEEMTPHNACRKKMVDMIVVICRLLAFVRTIYETEKVQNPSFQKRLAMESISSVYSAPLYAYFIQKRPTLVYLGGQGEEDHVHEN